MSKPHNVLKHSFIRLLLSCAFFHGTLIPSLMGQHSQAEAKNIYTVKDLVVFKQVGYSEGQIRQELEKTGQFGKFGLRPEDVNVLVKNGFRVAFIKTLGIASNPKTTTSPQRAKPTQVQQPSRPKPRQAQAAPRKLPPLPRKLPPLPRKLPPLPRELGPYKPLRKIPPHPKVQELIPYLQSSNYQQRLYAVQLLQTLGPYGYTAIPALYQQMKLPAVQQFGTNYVVTANLKKLVLLAFGRMGPYAHQTTLGLLTWMRDAQLRPVIEKILPFVADDPRRVGAQLVYALQARSSGPGWAFAVEQIGRLGPKAQKAIPVILPIFAAPSVQNWHGAYIVTAPLKQKACRTLAALGSTQPAVFWSLYKGLKQSGVKAHAIRALRRLFYNPRDPNTRKLWLTALRQTNNMEGVELAASVLASWPSVIRQALPTLLRLASTLPNHWKTQNVRLHVLKALGKIGANANAAIPVLFAHLKNKSFRAAATSALEQIITKPGEHLPFLKKVMNDKDHQAGHAYILRRLLHASLATKQAMLSHLAEQLRWRKQADMNLRLQAARILQSMGEAAAPAVQTLSRVLTPQRKERTNDDLQATAALTLGNLGAKGEPAIPSLLVAMSRSASVRQAARWALSKVMRQPLQHLDLFRKLLRTKRRLPSKRYAVSHIAHLVLAPDRFARTPESTKKQALQLWNNSKRIPRLLKIGGYMELAMVKVSKRPDAVGWKSLAAAIKLGYDDFLTLLTTSRWQRWHSHPTFRALYQQIKIRQGDRHELMWLWKELHATRHETSMMIMENMNRADQGVTEVPQAKVPMRLTTSYAVWLYRNLLNKALMHQKSTVFISDVQRRSHNTTMQIARNMGGRTSRWLNQQRQFQRLASRRLAIQRAQARRRRVKQRQFTPSSNSNVWTKGLPLQNIPKAKRTQSKNYAKQFLSTAHRLFKRAMYKKAAQAYSRALRLNPNLTKAYEGRGLSYINLKQYPLAVSDLKRVIEQAPTYALGWYYRGLSYFMVKRFPLAIQDFTQALKLNPKLAMAYNARGASYFRSKRTSLALADFTAGLKYNPKDAILLANRAYALGRLGRLAEAVVTWEKAYKLAPNDPYIPIVGAYLTLTNPKPVVLRVEQTLEWLEQGLDAGFQQLFVIHEEPTFDCLKRLPYFNALMAQHTQP